MTFWVRPESANVPSAIIPFAALPPTSCALPFPPRPWRRRRPPRPRRRWRSRCRVWNRGGRLEHRRGGRPSSQSGKMSAFFLLFLVSVGGTMRAVVAGIAGTPAGIVGSRTKVVIVAAVHNDPLLLTPPHTLLDLRPASGWQTHSSPLNFDDRPDKQRRKRPIAWRRRWRRPVGRRLPKFGRVEGRRWQRA